jgi:hypothetical protein
MTQTATQPASNVAARGLTPEERRSACRYLRQSRQALQNVVQGLSDDQWNFKPAPEAWSVAENVEHLVLVEQMVEGILSRLPGAAVAIVQRNDEEIETEVLAFVRDRSQRYPAPPDSQPTGRWTPAGALGRFLVAREHSEQLLQSPGLRGNVIPLGPVGLLDGYEWLLAVAAHTDRHVAQIQELKARPEFPTSPVELN